MLSATQRSRQTRLIFPCGIAREECGVPLGLRRSAGHAAQSLRTSALGYAHERVRDRLWLQSTQRFSEAPPKVCRCTCLARVSIPAPSEIQLLTSFVPFRYVFTA